MQPVGLYMFVDSSIDPTQHRAAIETPKFKMVIQGVRNIEEGSLLKKEFYLSNYKVPLASPEPKASQTRSMIEPR
jgi:hypothetical protein